MTEAMKGPLAGCTVVVTRAREQAADLVALLEARGAEVLCFPTIAIVDPDDMRPLDSAIANLSVYDWILFTSANAAERFFARLTADGRDARALFGAKVAAVGESTAAKLAAHGVTADFVPAEHRAEGLLDGLCVRGVGEGSRVLLPRALEAREVLPETLRERGAVVDVVPAYRTVRGPGDPSVAARLQAHEADAVTFTSGSTVRNFVALIGEDRIVDVMAGVTAASIGPVTTEAARKLGLDVAVEADPYTVDGLVGALERHFTA